MITSHTNTVNDIQLNAIELKGIGKSYRFINAGHIYSERLWALKDISLDIRKGKIIGIIGRNGAGKTTLLNIIAGVLPPTYGKAFVKDRVLGLFNLGVGFQDELTGRENIFLNGAILGATRKELDTKLNSIIEFSELGDFINMPLGTYSQGMRLRLGFSIIANLDFDILVIDEVMAVGDALFQSKCFERIMDFKRIGKTLIISTQSMELIERLCDEVVLLDHGNMLFQGEPSAGISKYRALLNSEKFFVGHSGLDQLRLRSSASYPLGNLRSCGAGQGSLIQNTKKWADDVSEWGKKLGTKEVVIEFVEFINRFGFRCSEIKTGESLKVKVHFYAKNRIKEPHFGVAIFREDGVYCYGPNTAFDGYYVPEIEKGKGYFTLSYHKILLASGDYRISIAIWDKNETLAFDYHSGYYKLKVKGYDNTANELLNIPSKPRRLSAIGGQPTRLGRLNNVEIESLKFFDAHNQEKNVFITNEPVKICINFTKINKTDKNSYLWLGIYRDDGIFCQGITLPLKRKEISISFPKLTLLPGGYYISTGEYTYPFRMVFDKDDHGTVYLEHKWQWRLLKK